MEKDKDINLDIQRNILKGTIHIFKTAEQMSKEKEISNAIEEISN